MKKNLCVIFSLLMIVLMSACGNSAVVGSYELANYPATTLELSADGGYVISYERGEDQIGIYESTEIILTFNLDTLRTQAGGALSPEWRQFMISDGHLVSRTGYFSGYIELAPEGGSLDGTELYLYIPIGVQSYEQRLRFLPEERVTWTTYLLGEGLVENVLSETIYVYEREGKFIYLTPEDESERPLTLYQFDDYSLAYSYFRKTS